MRGRSYLDTSFLVKTYIAERESEDVTEFINQQVGELLVSSLSDVEIVSTLYRRLPRVEAESASALYRFDREHGLYH